MGQAEWLHAASVHEQVCAKPGQAWQEPSLASLTQIGIEMLQTSLGCMQSLSALTFDRADAAGTQHSFQVPTWRTAMPVTMSSRISCKGVG